MHCYIIRLDIEGQRSNYEGFVDRILFKWQHGKALQRFNQNDALIKRLYEICGESIPSAPEGLLLHVSLAGYLDVTQSLIDQSGDYSQLDSKIYYSLFLQSMEHPSNNGWAILFNQSIQSLAISERRLLEAQFEFWYEKIRPIFLYDTFDNDKAVRNELCKKLGLQPTQSEQDIKYLLFWRSVNTGYIDRAQHLLESG
jgi:hypothetical protein